MKGKVIAISGLDGSGKTVIIRALENKLKKQNISTSYVWLRYNHYLTKFLLAFCRVIRLTKYHNIDGIRIGYHEFYRSKLISYLFILLTYIDTLMISVITVYIPALFTSNTIICDRWIFDIMVDLEIDTGINLNKGGFIKKIFKAIVPKNAFYFIIQRNPQELIKVRRENDIDRNFMKRIELYQVYSLDPVVKEIQNDRNIHDAVDQIILSLPK